MSTDTAANKENIKATQIEQKIMSDTVREMAFELQRLRENESHEREKLILKLEAILARSDRNLLTSGPTDHERIAVLEFRIAALIEKVDEISTRLDQLDSKGLATKLLE